MYVISSKNREIKEEFLDFLSLENGTNVFAPKRWLEIITV
jgi:hypothetical protein